MKTLNLFTGITAMLLVAACGKNEPSVTWIEGQADENGKAVHEIVLKNIPAGGRVWFARIPQQITMPEDATAEIKFYKGNSYYIDVPQHEGKELSIKYISELLPRKSWAPEGFYLQQDGKQDILHHIFADEQGKLRSQGGAGESCQGGRNGQLQVDEPVTQETACGQTGAAGGGQLVGCNSLMNRQAGQQISRERDQPTASTDGIHKSGQEQQGTDDQKR